MMEENLSDFLLFLIHSNKFHKNKIRRTIFNQKSSTWKSKKYIKEEWIPISYSRVNKHTNRWQKKVNQETKKPRNLLDLDRSTTHRHSTRYSLIDRHFRSHEHRNLWSRFFVSSFPSPRTHFSFLIGGRWRRKIGEISPSNFSTDDQPTLLPPPRWRSSSPRHGKTDEYESAGRPTF